MIKIKQRGFSLIEATCVLAIIGGLTLYTTMMADQVSDLAVSFQSEDAARVQQVIDRYNSFFKSVEPHDSEGLDNAD